MAAARSNEVEGALDRLKGTIIKSVRKRLAANGQRTLREVEAEGLLGSYKVVLHGQRQNCRP
jgi:hypothetical protein